MQALNIRDVTVGRLIVDGTAIAENRLTVLMYRLVTLNL